jgi:hypothetical protein
MRATYPSCELAERLEALRRISGPPWGMLPVELVEVVVLDMRRDEGYPMGGAIVCGETAEPGTP